MPEIDHIGVRKGLLRQHERTIGKYVFDGTLIYSATRLNEVSSRILSCQSRWSQSRWSQSQSWSWKLLGRRPVLVTSGGFWGLPGSSQRPHPHGQPVGRKFEGWSWRCLRPHPHGGGAGTARRPDLSRSTRSRSIKCSSDSFFFIRFFWQIHFQFFLLVKLVVRRGVTI